MHRSKVGQPVSALLSSRQLVRCGCAGLDIDREALLWGLRHNGEGLIGGPAPRLCLLQCDVRDPVEAARSVALPPPAEHDASAASAAAAGPAAGEVAALRLEDGNDAPHSMHQDASLAAGSASGHPAACPGAPAAGGSSGAGQQQGGRPANGHIPAELSRGEEHASPGPLSQQEAEGGGGSGPDGDAAAEQEDLRSRAADVVCAFNFSVCLLHERAEVQVGGAPPQAVGFTVPKPKKPSAVHMPGKACCAHRQSSEETRAMRLGSGPSLLVDKNVESAGLCPQH